MDSFPEISFKPAKSELLVLLKLSWPTAVVTISCLGICITSTIVCGHIGKLEMDAVILADTMITIFGIAVSLGFSSACDTFFSNTVGTGNMKRVGIYLQRSFAASLPLLLLLTAIHINMERVLLLFGQEPILCKMAADYCLIFIPGLYFESSFLILCRYLQNQNYLFGPMVASFVAVIMNTVSQYVAVFILGYSYLASAVLQASAYGVAFLSLLGYILISGIYKDTWGGWRPLEMIKNFKQFYFLAIAAILMVMFEETSYEFGTIAAGILGQVPLAAQGILFWIESVAYTIPLSISVAVNVRVGFHLGSGNHEKAQLAYRLGLLIVFFSSTLMTCLFLMLSNEIPKIFTTDKDVILKTKDTLWIFCLFQYLDGVLAISAGALKACGRQLVASIFVFIGYWVIGTPLGITLAFAAKMDVKGIWLGLICGIGVVAFGFQVLVCTIDWKSESEKAQKRVLADDEMKKPLATVEEFPNYVDELPKHLGSVGEFREPLLKQNMNKMASALELGTIMHVRSIEMLHKRTPIMARKTIPKSRNIKENIKFLLFKRFILYFSMIMLVCISVAVRLIFAVDLPDQSNLPNSTSIPILSTKFSIN